MSLWTPGGEHEVPREGGRASSGPPDAGDHQELTLDDLDPEERARAEQMIAEMAEAQQRLVEAPPEVVVGNHVIGLYELAALHLQQDPPDLEAAQLAIDGMAAVVERLDDRLGETREPLRNALMQIQSAFVQIKAQASSG